ncbi:MAG: MarR family winged helix-turn-helix transcriptional regulator [Micropruina sp.]
MAQETPSLPVLLFIAQRAVESRVVAAVHAAGHTELTLALGRVAARIGPAGTRLTELAEQAQVAKQTVTAAVDRLERLGYVERVPDPIDARARLVRLAPLGDQVVAIARAEEAAVLAEWTTHLSPLRMAQLSNILRSLREITDPYAR